MRKLLDLLSDFYTNSKIGRFVIRPFKLLYWELKFNKITDRTYVKRKFEASFGRPLSLEAPTSFNEKMQWLKLNERTKLHTVCADKLKVREFVKQKIGGHYLIPLIRVLDNAKDINYDTLGGRPCVVKCNHDSGCVFVLSTPEQANLEVMRNALHKSLNTNFYHLHREWQYKNIRPKILIEALIADKDGSVPKDYKFFCFNGKPTIIQVDTDRFSNHQRSMFNEKWELMDFELLYPTAGNLPPPSNLDLMLDLASILSSEFKFARVDFYDTGDAVYFGEITFNPGSGFEKFKPESWDYKVGSYLQLS